MQMRRYLALAIATAVIATVGWFSGASAATSGYITWAQFGSSGVPLCGSHLASMNDSPGPWTSTAKERTLNRSGTSCGSLRTRPAGKIYIEVHWLRNGAVFFSSDAVNPSNDSSVQQVIQATDSGDFCWSALGAGGEWDNDLGRFIRPTAFANSGQDCAV